MSKGPGFEREFCKTLSRWWTALLSEPRDDVFWRTSQSGGRATTRRKRGQSTFGQHGDIAATDPIGLPLLENFLFELKRGYNKNTFADFLDRPGSGCSVYEEWVGKVQSNLAASGAQYWAIVARRDRRRPIVLSTWLPWRSSLCHAELLMDNVGVTPWLMVYCYTLDDWLEAAEVFRPRPDQT